MIKKIFLPLLCALLFSISFVFAQNSNTAILPPASLAPQANSTVRGRVFYADTGRPVKRTSILLIQADASGGPGEAVGLTDGDGNFQIKNVKAGTYYAIVNAPGVVSPMAFADFSKLGSGGGDKEAFANAFTDFEKIVVNGINDLDVQVPARRGGAISGRVMYDDGDTAVGVKIEILRKVGDKFLPVLSNFSAVFSMFTTGSGFQTDDRGAYRFPGLPPGEYIVKVTENTRHGENNEQNYRSFEATMFGGNSFLTIFYPDVFELKSAQVIPVEYGQELGEINLTIPTRNLFKVEGKIISRKDKSPVKAQITITKTGDEQKISQFNIYNRVPQKSQTDEQGNWTFKELPKGTYKITVEPVESVGEYESGYSNTNRPVSNLPPRPKLSKTVREITIDDKNLSDVTVELGSGANVSGTVAVEDRREMPNYVTVQAVSENEEISTSAALNNYYYEGSEKPRQMNHEFKLEAVTEGKTFLRVTISDDDYYLKSATVGGTDWLAGPIELKEGENLQKVQIILGKGTGLLKGKILDAANEPVKNTPVTFVPTDAKRKNSSFYKTVRTDENGEFEVRLAPNEYAAVFLTEEAAARKGDEFHKWLDEAIKGAQTVKIEAGKTETLTVRKKN